MPARARAPATLITWRGRLRANSSAAEAVAAPPPLRRHGTAQPIGTWLAITAASHACRATLVHVQWRPAGRPPLLGIAPLRPPLVRRPRGAPRDAPPPGRPNVLRASPRRRITLDALEHCDNRGHPISRARSIGRMRSARRRREARIFRRGARAAGGVGRAALRDTHPHLEVRALGVRAKKISAASRLPQHAARCSGSQLPCGGGGVGVSAAAAAATAGGRRRGEGVGRGESGAGARTLFRTAAPSGYVSYIRCTTSARPPKAATRCAGKYPYCGARRGRSDAVRTGAGCGSGNSTATCKLGARVWRARCAPRRSRRTTRGAR